jgi:pyrroline-5-carboxylate reductase
MQAHIAFIGGGNMASALIGGLLRQGLAADHLHVIEPFAPTRQQLLDAHGVTALATPDASLDQAELVVWAVKPQVFKEAAEQSGAFTQRALHLSVAAGIRTDSMVTWLQTERVVRAMPNTPALIGMGQTGLYARPGVSAEDRKLIEQVMSSTGQCLWVEQESLLDAVTAISGSGPAYVFYFIEAMCRSAERMGLSPEQARQLAIGTFSGAAELAHRSADAPAVLRERVTSKGGTTYAALTSMQASSVAEHFEKALEAARARAAELGDEFGR